MAHVAQNKKKLFAGIGRIRGRINGIEKAIEEGRECGEVLLTLAARRGALNSLMSEILEGHVRQHLLGPRGKRPGTHRWRGINRSHQETRQRNRVTTYADRVRLEIMALIVVASLTGWWHPFMNRD